MSKMKNWYIEMCEDTAEIIQENLKENGQEELDTNTAYEVATTIVDHILEVKPWYQ